MARVARKNKRLSSEQEYRSLSSKRFFLLLKPENNPWKVFKGQSLILAENGKKGAKIVFFDLFGSMKDI